MHTKHIPLLDQLSSIWHCLNNLGGGFHSGIRRIGGEIFYFVYGPCVPGLDGLRCYVAGLLVLDSVYFAVLFHEYVLSLPLEVTFNDVVSSFILMS